jgi:hypothetical protein
MAEPAAAPRRLLPLFVLTLFLVGGCAALRISRYYGGANLHSDGGALVRPVTVRVDADLQPFSRSCVESLLKQDVDSLRKMASGDLPAQLEEGSFPERLRVTSEKYGLAGTFDQIEFNGGGFWFDDMISRDPYKTYTFFTTEFLLPGKTNAHAFLLIKRSGNDVSLIGFDIHRADSQGANPDLRLMPKAFKGWKRL